MTENRWTDRIVGDRMAVDREFTDDVEQSEFSRQEWGLIMTAVEFEIANPGEADAELVANTSKLPQIMPELEKLTSQMNSMGGGGRSSGRGGRSSGGFVDSVKGALGLGGGTSGGSADEERLANATALVEAYAGQLQQRLEARGTWDEVQQAARE